eukprot:gene4680-15221_t
MGDAMPRGGGGGWGGWGPPPLMRVCDVVRLCPICRRARCAGGGCAVGGRPPAAAPAAAPRGAPRGGPPPAVRVAPCDSL